MALLHEWLLPNYLLTAAQARGMARFFPTIFKTFSEGFGPSPWFPAQHSSTSGDGSKPWYLVNPKIAGKWMFIPLKMVLIGIDPYPSVCSPSMVQPAGDWYSTRCSESLVNIIRLDCCCFGHGKKQFYTDWNIFYFSIYWELHNPNWLICFRGVKKPTSIQLSISFSIDQLLFWWFRDVCLIFACPFWQLCSSANN